MSVLSTSIDDPSIADRFWQIAQPSPANTSPVEVVAEFLVALRGFLKDGDHDLDYGEATTLLLNCLKRREVAGDLTYASPEQARGEHVDERSLVFSVGVLLFERLTKRHPFGVEGRVEREERLRKRELASGVNYFPQIPAELRVIIVKAIAAFPEERWHNLQDLERQLTGFLQLANTPESQRVLAQRRLPALPDVPSRSPSGPREPLRADSSIDHRFLPVLTREVQLERIATEAQPVNKRRAAAIAATIAAGLILGIAPLSLSSDSDAEPQSRATDVTTAANPATPTPAAMLKPTIVAAPMRSAKPIPAAAASAATKPIAAAAPTSATNPAAAEKSEAAPADDPVLVAALSCFPRKRLATAIYFGVSLVFDPATGLSKRAFLGGASKLNGAEKSCLNKGLIGIKRSQPGDEPILSYRLMLSTASSFVRLKP